MHVGNEKDPILSWMIREVPVMAKWSEFGTILGYKACTGSRIHDGDHPSVKEVLIPITLPSGIPGQMKDLISSIEIMHRVFHETNTVLPLVWAIWTKCMGLCLIFRSCAVRSKVPERSWTLCMSSFRRCGSLLLISVHPPMVPTS